MCYTLTNCQENNFFKQKLYKLCIGPFKGHTNSFIGKVLSQGSSMLLGTQHPGNVAMN